MDRIVEKLKALGEENRYRIALMLLERPLCVCEILEVLDIAGGTLSGHLKVLVASGLVSGKKNGKWVEYFLAGPEASALVSRTKDFLSDPQAYEKDLVIIRTLDKYSCSLKVRKSEYSQMPL